eukprot:TRINITY_DN414_c0_g1_i2.p1 TRINITY_DN414_c0_g1~~TRINITY_DN414_c0_g1_i2.p1  ORF type:complete len:182 (-),score=33.91 TRINITY_DN414_c0_g1_i2:152-697(-)
METEQKPLYVIHIYNEKRSFDVLDEVKFKHCLAGLRIRNVNKQHTSYFFFPQNDFKSSCASYLKNDFTLKEKVSEENEFKFEYEGFFQIVHFDKKKLIIAYPEKGDIKYLCIEKKGDWFIINDKFYQKEFPHQILSQEENFVNAILDLLPENNDAIGIAKEFIGKETDLFSEAIDIEEFIF